MSSRQNKIDAELRASACPRCGKFEVLQPIIYGLPNEDFDFENFESSSAQSNAESPPPKIEIFLFLKKSLFFTA